MSEPTKGVLFVPIPPDDVAWKSDLVRRALRELGGMQQLQEIFAITDLSHLSEEQAIERIVASPRASWMTSAALADFWMTLWIFRTRPEASYQELNTHIPRMAFSEIQHDPMRVEAFAARWIHLCEAVGAEAAYFVEGTYNDPEEVTDRCVAALQQGDVDGFLRAEVAPWRGYVGPALVARKGKELDVSWAERVETLPSGALVITSGRGHNPEVGDFDALPNATFLREQLEQHLEIAGSDHLLDIVRQQEKRLARIVDDKDYLKHGEDAYYDWDGLKEARVVLDEVRAIWACALYRSGLVGVQQAFADGTPQGKVIVPIVADEGREWLIATLLFPFARDATLWLDPQTGLRTQVQRLLHAAQLQPHPPRVVFYAWRGVSDEVREDLAALGVGVEVATSLPLLGAS